MTRGQAGWRTLPPHGTLMPGRRAVEGVSMRRFLKDEQGQGMAEYALIIAVVALALILTQVFFADKVKNFFSNVGNNLT